MCYLYCELVFIGRPPRILYVTNNILCHFKRLLIDTHCFEIVCYLVRFVYLLISIHGRSQLQVSDENRIVCVTWLTGFKWRTKYVLKLLNLGIVWKYWLSKASTDSHVKIRSHSLPWKTTIVTKCDFFYRKT